jgi:hypothetical protein
MPFHTTESAESIFPNSFVKEFVPLGGTNAVQPTFNGLPRFYGIYTRIGDLVYFSINVDFSNITSFGNGQYYMTIPFNANQDLYFREGHLHDESNSKSYAISGHVESGSNIMYLTYTSTNGHDAEFTSTNPFILTPQDNFHIQGTYIN